MSSLLEKGHWATLIQISWNPTISTQICFATLDSSWGGALSYVLLLTWHSYTKHDYTKINHDCECREGLDVGGPLFGYWGIFVPWAVGLCKSLLDVYQGFPWMYAEEEVQVRRRGGVGKGGGRMDVSFFDSLIVKAGEELSRGVRDWHILVQGSTRHMLWRAN